MQTYTSKDLLKGLRRRDERVIRYVYSTCFPEIRKLVVSNMGSEADAQDVFQESMLVVYDKLFSRRLRLKSSFNTYLFSVCRLIWLKELKNRANNKTEEFNEDNQPGTLKSGVEKLESAKMNIYRRHFSELSWECRRVLRMYFRNASMEEICAAMGYKNIQIAKDKKYRCKKSLIAKIAGNPEYKKVSDEIQLVG